jgi:hypothetical protein
MANIYGEIPTEGGDSLENGGIIDGDLEITQDLTVDGDAVINGSLTVDTIISDLEIEDALITCGFNNPDDLLNTGLLLGHDFSTSARYGGIVRRATDKRLVALQSVAPKPTPTGIIPSSDAILECAELATDKILSDSNNLAIDSNLITLNGSSVINFDGLPQQAIASVSGIELIVQGQGRTAIRSNNGRVSIESQGTNSDIILESGENVIIESGPNSGDSILINSQAGDIKLTSNSDMVLETTGQIDLLGAVVVCNKGSNQFFLPADRGSANQVLTTDGSGGTSWQNINLQGASFGNLNMVGNGTTTTFLTTQTYTPIGGVMSAGPLADFTLGTNLLTYTGVETLNFLVNVSQAWIHGGGTPDEFRLAVFKNGVIVAASVQRANLDSDTDYPRSSSTNAILELATNDTIEVRVANFDDTTPVTVVDFALSVINVSAVVGGGGGSGDVNGPPLSTDSALVLFDGVTGKLIKDSSSTLNTIGELYLPGANSRLRLDNGLREFQLRNQSYFELFQQDSGGGNPEVILNTQNSRVNVFRETWLQGNVVINASPNNYVLPTIPPVPGQYLVADSPNTTTWVDPKAFHCNAMVGNSTPTIFTSIGQTLTFIGTSTTSGLSRGGPWSVIGTSVRYDGTRNLNNCKIELSGSFTGLGADRLFSIRRNLITLTGSQGTFFATSNKVCYYTQAFASIFTGDIIQPSITSLVTNSQNVITDMNLTITEL